MTATQTATKIPSDADRTNFNFLIHGHDDQNKRRFVWGPIVEVHHVGDFAIVEYVSDGDFSDRGEVIFHPYLHGQKWPNVGAYQTTGMGFSSLDDAVIGAIAYRNLGANTAQHIAPLISKMLAPEVQS